MTPCPSACSAGALPTEPWAFIIFESGFCSQIGSHSVAQAGPELMMILYLSPTSAGIAGVSTVSDCVKLCV